MFRSLRTCTFVIWATAWIASIGAAQTTLVAWGNNDSGQGNVPPIPPGLSFTAFTGGLAHTVALLSDGTVSAWGHNGNGQCVVPPLAPGIVYTSVASSAATSFALRSDGTIAAWGTSAYSLTTAPALPPSLSYTGVASGSSAYHVLATRSDGSLVAWGYNGYGQCNVLSLPTGVSYVQAALSFRHSIALRSDGSVVAWGSNNSGQLDVPPLPPGITYVQVAAGGYDGGGHSLAIRSDGLLLAWGLNNAGQTNTPPLPPGVTYVKAAAGETHSLALRSDGKVVAFGLLGSGVPQPAVTRFLDIGAGSNHSLGLREPICTAVPYCTSMTNLIGCMPTISYSGSTNMSGPDDFYITASNLTSQQAGIMIWSTAPYSALFYGGTLCVAPPINRTTPLNSNGSGAPFDCTGTFSFHWSDAYMASQGITPGIARYAQFWMRDPFPILGVGLSNGLEFMICP